jgi:hypothetical protein
MNNEESLVHILFPIVGGLLTLLYGIGGWNWITLNKEVKELRVALLEKSDNDDVDKKHLENRAEFKNIEDLLGALRTLIETNERRSAELRERMQRDVQTLAADVAGIKGYISGSQK